MYIYLSCTKSVDKNINQKYETPIIVEKKHQFIYSIQVDTVLYKYLWPLRANGSANRTYTHTCAHT